MSGQTTINLEKGQRVDLTKTNAGLKVAKIGLGWDINAGNSGTFDLDAFALALKGGKMPSQDNLLYFNSPKGSDGMPFILGGAIQHTGDNLTGQGDGDDETLIVNLDKLGDQCDEILICVNVYQAQQKGQNFGMVNNAFIRVYDGDTKEEILKFDLTEDYSAFNGMVMGKLYKKDGEWKFQAVAEGKNGTIVDIAQPYSN